MLVQRNEFICEENEGNYTYLGKLNIKLPILGPSAALEIFSSAHKSQKNARSRYLVP